MLEQMFIYGFIFLIGLIFGSFFNVVSLRTLSGEKLAFPPSHCTNCNHQLGFFDLFPVISYTLLGGKCRYCKVKISPIYPIGELLTATSFVIVFHKFGFTLEALAHLVFLIVMVLSAVTDLKETVVPVIFVYIGLGLVAILRLIIAEDIMYYFGSAVIAYLGMQMIKFLSKRKVKINGVEETVYGLGDADIDLYALIGLSIGIFNSIGSLFYAAFIGVIFQLPTLLSKLSKKDKTNRGQEIPFVPFITLGVLCTYFLNYFMFLQ